MKKKIDFLGVDFGSQLAGTTVISYVDENNTARLLQSERKKSADDFLKANIERLNPSSIFFDAPLSLPGVYQNITECTDFFYRQCDRELKAMSPMFIGGLTARAMKLKAHFLPKPIHFFETYPKQIAKRLELPADIYKKTPQIVEVVKFLQPVLPFRIIPSTIQNLHQIDSLLCLFLGFQFVNGNANQSGREDEGCIYW